MQNTNKKQIIGIIWMVLHCLFVSVILAMVRSASDRHFNVFQTTFFYSFFTFLFSFIWLVFIKKGDLKQKFQVESKHYLHIARGILGATSMIIFFYTLTLMPLTEARAIASTCPLVSSLFAILFLKEKTGIYRIIGLFCGFFGGLIIINPTGAGFSYASLLVLVSVIMWAIIDQIIRMLGKRESIAIQMCYYTFIMSLICSVPAFYYWQTVTFTDSLFFIIMGMIFVFNSASVSQALKHADVNTVMPFDFSGMVFTIIIAYLAFGEIINFHTFLGSVIIIISTLYVIHREGRRAKKIHEADLKTPG